MPFVVFLKNFEVLLYEIMSWIVFYPRTLWRSGRHPLQMMTRAEQELELEPSQQFKDVVSPPIFLLLTVIAASGFEVAVVGNSPLIDNGVGLAALITDNSSLILFRLIAFATLPVIAGAFALARMGRPVDRDTLQPLFYGQCFATTPVVLLSSVAESISRLPQVTADMAADLLFALAIAFYIGVEASWFSRETKRGTFAGLAWALGAFAISVAVLGVAVLAFAGI